jgi:hypothetical protein
MPIMRKTKIIATALSLLACFLSTPVAAQKTATSAVAGCTGGDRVVVADLGFSFECSCVFRPHTAGGPTWDFRSEPRITDVGRRGPAHGLLREGDTLVAIDDKLITTREGGELFARARDGEQVVLTIRRDGHQMTVKFAAMQTCLDENQPPAPVAAYPSVPAAPALAPVPSAPALSATPAPSEPAARPPRAPRTPSLPPTYPPEPPLPTLALEFPTYPESFPLAWFGFGLSCGDCGFAPSTLKASKRVKGVGPQWKFSTPPEIYSVDASSPADAAGLRRGDILTSIDGVSLTTTQGGRKFGDVVPGQRVRLGYRRGAERHFVYLIAERRPEYTPRPDSYRLGTTAPVARSAQRLRYSGSIGGADVEVRGVGSVVVNSSGDEIIITTGDTTVRIRAGVKKQ